MRCAAGRSGFTEAAFAEVSDIVATALLPGFDDAVKAALQARFNLPQRPEVPRNFP